MEALGICETYVYKSVEPVAVAQSYKPFYAECAEYPNLGTDEK